MSRFSRLFASIAASSLLCLPCLATLACSGGAPGASEARSSSRTPMRAVAVSPEVDEPRVLAALSARGIDDALVASRVMVPFSDFSRVVDAPLDSALRRSRDADPRRTPFLEELASRFTATGPDGSAWTVVYLPGPTAERDEAAALSLTSLGADWAWDARSGAHSSPILWLPAATFALWLVVRKPKSGRTARLVVALASSPLLAPGAIGASTLFVSLTAAFAAAYGAARSAPTRRRDHSRAILKALWPYGFAIAAPLAAIVALERSSLPYLAASAGLAALSVALYPRLAKVSASRRLHGAPRFVALTGSRTTRESRSVAKAMLAPVLAMAAMQPFASTGVYRAGDASPGPAFSLTRSQRGVEDRTDAESLLAEHLAYQEALTYGRIGDAAWGRSGYDPVYRYAEEGGRMIRSPAEDPAPRPASRGAYAEALAALRERVPSSIVPISDKKARGR
ncbi:MAG TPA: hypothetical protein PK179_12755 [Spirochaetales bacterium]|nr:hypothetical protein [Spirochaetales bacterium]